MKNLLFILIFNSLAFVSNAQIINVNEINYRNQKETTIYCDIESRNFLASFTPREYIDVDFGQTQKNNNELKDADGNAIVFKSIVDALNFMSKEGWSLINTYNFTDLDTKVLHVHYIMSKKVLQN